MAERTNLTSIIPYVEQLSRFASDGAVFNLYGNVPGDSLLATANAIRRRNLRLYLSSMAAVRPWLLLVGEAPGYRGCRLTGVPFTSEAILLDNTIWPFGRKAGFGKTAERQQVVKEATATMLWSALAGWRPPPLLWNAFPFHPHQAGLPDSNRQPDRQELLQGAALLADLLDIFQPRVVAAVGRCAAGALERAGLGDYHPLRHPSHGGKSAFLAGLDRLRSLAGMT